MVKETHREGMDRDKRFKRKVRGSNKKGQGRWSDKSVKPGLDRGREERKRGKEEYLRS